MSPIRPADRARYPADWRHISDSIRFGRAGGQCECGGECGHRHPGGRCAGPTPGPPPHHRRGGRAQRRPPRPHPGKQRRDEPARDVPTLPYVESGAATFSVMGVTWARYPRVAGHGQARRWLEFISNVGRARNTVDAYGRALEDHLRFCGRVDADSLTLGAEVVAAWIGDMLERPNPKATNVVGVDSRAGLANATVQQRVVAVRSFTSSSSKRGCASATRSGVGSPLGVATGPAGFGAPRRAGSLDSE